MKKVFSLLLAVILFTSIDAFAQLRGDVSRPFDYQGAVINATTPSIQSKLNKFFSNVKMSHSYSMSFSSFGGSYQNVNAYTNTMQFAFSDRFNGRVDVSLFHSPFGGNNSFGMNTNQPQVMISNAELNYKLGENSMIRLQYQRLPNTFGFGPSPFGYGYNRYNPWYR